MDVKYNVCLAHDNDVDIEAFLTTHHAKLQQLSGMLNSFESVEDILVVYLDNDKYPQMVAVNEDKVKVAHIILSDVVLSGPWNAWCLLIKVSHFFRRSQRVVRINY